ncbi:hypothetical protein PGT21_018313 [Puccinia graminis f. sp. tritici]|uniref:Uncharacterized protein n=1 Tax=Puccinia graminis f. sp. tritici TaxID=56615 RepID=A0A5B0QIZ3_PUCGR|nr:hypothetical protein PGT21_018313 [Puccinia graminis f. sp. tritici]
MSLATLEIECKWNETIALRTHVLAQDPHDSRVFGENRSTTIHKVNPRVRASTGVDSSAARSRSRHGGLVRLEHAGIAASVLGLHWRGQLRCSLPLPPWRPSSKSIRIGVQIRQD